jgi:CrcB protein
VNALGVLYLALGGAVGSVARVLVALGLERALGSAYPWGTTAVNLLGSFAFGLLFALWESKDGVPTPLRLLALSGFMGAFTTFSTLMFEVAVLFSGGKGALGAVHLLLHNALGLVCIFAGLWLGKALS